MPRKEDDTAENVRMIRDSTRAVVAADGSLARIRAQRFQEPGFDAATFATMAEMGWLTLRLPEEAGGLGLGMAEYCALTQELGAALLPEPLIGTALAVRMAGADLSDAGICIAAWQDEANELGWRKSRIDGGRITGSKHFIPNATGADSFAVATADGVAIVAKEASGLSVTSEWTQDGCGLGTLKLRDVTPLAIHPADAVDDALDEAALATASYLFGLSERVFAMTIEYLKTRKQFGQPIGSFQALQHRATDIKIQLELARASIAAAAAVLDDGAGRAARASAVSRAKCRANDTALLASREAIQMHGAIGFTDEYDAGLFVRKAMTLCNQFGSSAVHRKRFAALLKEAA
ncbi:MAG: acyl-CoA dehydrogenase family protein [Pseudolabrys sp.]|nr:acyl-CoA dehydrogenase family protein [Pseudolabrys sp.]